MTLDELKLTFGDEAEQQAYKRWMDNRSNEDLRWEYLIIRDNNKKCMAQRIKHKIKEF